MPPGPSESHRGSVQLRQPGQRRRGGTEGTARRGADGPTTLARDATAAILREVEHWWLHVDLDVLSTKSLPAVDYPQDGGLSWTQLEDLTAAALEAPGCLGFTVCIYNRTWTRTATTRIAS